MNSGHGRSDPVRSLLELRLATAAGLRAREAEINEAVIHRALSVAPPTGKEAPGYAEALRAAIPSAIGYVFEAIEHGEERIGPTPATVFAQTAASARNQVGLEVVLRRYAAGYSTLSDFLHQEVRAQQGDSGVGHSILQRELTAVFDRLVVDVSETYRREKARAIPSPRRRQLECIRRLLAGELVDTHVLDYPLEASHLAVIVSGPEPGALAASLARELDRRLLIGEESGERITAWLGGPSPVDQRELEVAARPFLGESLRLSIGEPGGGLPGWRRSCRQAEAARLVAGRASDRVVCYRDVALLAAALRDPDLTHFLTVSYLAPLGEERAPLLPTLEAFFRAGRHTSSAAAALGVSRQTVTSRLRVVEERLGQRLEDCAAQLDTALALAGLEG